MHIEVSADRMTENIMVRLSIIVFFLVVGIDLTSAFSTITRTVRIPILSRTAQSPFSTSYRTPSLQILHANPLEGTPLESLYTLVKAREACPPQVCIEQLFISVIRSLNLPEPLIHWGHPVAMILAISFLGGYGLYQGYLIRSSKDISAKRKAAAFHPTLMSILIGVMFIGAQGGLSSLLVQEHPILESSHAGSALLMFGMLTVQALLSSLISVSPIARNAHAYFGVATIAVVLYHITTGFSLGLEL